MRPSLPSLLPAPIFGRPNRRLWALALVAIVLAGCGGTASPPPSFPSDAVIVHAKNRTFDKGELQIPAGKEFTLVLVNEDSDLHNIALRTAADGKGDLLFRFDPVSLKTAVVTVPSIPKGNYFFLCEVHPSMFGTVFVY